MKCKEALSTENRLFLERVKYWALSRSVQASAKKQGRGVGGVETQASAKSQNVAVELTHTLASWMAAKGQLRWDLVSYSGFAGIHNGIGMCRQLQSAGLTLTLILIHVWAAGVSLEAAEILESNFIWGKDLMLEITYCRYAKH